MAHGRQDGSYTLDAEGRVVTANLATGGTETYGYDGDGYRVLKTAGGETGSTYWYGADGTVTDEQTVHLNPTTGWGNNVRNLYFNGHLAMRMGFIESVFPSLLILPDQIGSSRVTIGLYGGTGTTGSTNARITNNDFYPFGSLRQPTSHQPRTTIHRQDQRHRNQQRLLRRKILQLLPR